jgi:biopolymer transport protein ExbD
MTAAPDHPDAHDRNLPRSAASIASARADTTRAPAPAPALGASGADVVPGDRDRWRRAHAIAGKRAVRRSVFTVNLAAMIDVIFLLLMYFLLSMDFTPDESALPAAVAGEPGQLAPADPFELPLQPILVTVRTTATIDPATVAADERAPGAFTLATDSPLLQNLAATAASASAAEALRARLTALRGDVLATDQPFVIRPAGDTQWEHAVTAFNAVLDAGFERVRFATPDGG